MCGIAGYASLDARAKLDPQQIGPMLHCVRHRGPDDQGVFAAEGIVLGHRRLSIIDVEHGHQPLFGQRAGTAIIANGEIYNYRELRRELEQKGHHFRTRSDSEVAAHAYDAWGFDFLDRLDGMFALAIWDAAERRLILARDRMGEKPLFYARTDRLLVFASELSAILAHPAIKPEIDPLALAEYLALEYIPAPHALVRPARKLEPGTALVLERGEMRTLRYWRLDPQPHQPAPAFRDTAERLRLELDKAVHSRLVSDVPLGVFLSGGIDSSIVAALAARAGALETFSIGFEEQSFDESDWARRVAVHIGSRHHERMVCVHEMPDLLPRLGEWLDEPIGDSSILPTALLSRFAREHVTVALGGDGGDELFAGYPMHQGRCVAPFVQALPKAALSAAAVLARRLPVSHSNFAFGFKVNTFLRGATLEEPLDHLTWMASFPPQAQRELLQPDLLREARSAAHAFDIPLAHWREAEGAPPLARACYLDATTYLPNDILTKVDRASMAAALEVRAPFLARAVVELAFSLPDSYRMHGASGKRILRHAVRDLLPPEILRRPKKGFGMPVAAWLLGPLREFVHDVLSPDSLARVGWFRPETVSRLIAEHERGTADHRKPLWTLLILELWRRHHL